MNYEEFELMIEPLKLSMIDTMTPPTLGEYTAALAEVQRRAHQREIAKGIREHLQDLREEIQRYEVRRRFDPANFYGGFTYSSSNCQFIVTNDYKNDHTQEGVRTHEQPTHGDEADAQQDSPSRCPTAQAAAEQTGS